MTIAVPEIFQGFGVFVKLSAGAAIFIARLENIPRIMRGGDNL